MFHNDDVGLQFYELKRVRISNGPISFHSHSYIEPVAISNSIYIYTYAQTQNTLVHNQHMLSRAHIQVIMSMNVDWSNVSNGQTFIALVCRNFTMKLSNSVLTVNMWRCLHIVFPIAIDSNSPIMITIYMSIAFFRNFFIPFQMQFDFSSSFCLTFNFFSNASWKIRFLFQCILGWNGINGAFHNINEIEIVYSQHVYQLWEKEGAFCHKVNATEISWETKKKTVYMYKHIEW